MIFTDLRFLVLFVACWVTFFIVPQKLRSAALAFWGALFYWMYAGWFLAAVVGLVLATLFSESRRIAWIVGGTIVGLLVIFKVGAGANLGSHPEQSAIQIVLPLGFSYLSFELLHVVIDRRQGRIATLHPGDLLAFALFMPCRIAGPIRRLPDFSAAVARARATPADVYAGLLRILLGLAKKLMLADTLALTTAEISYVSTRRQAWTIVLVYTFRIFFDFSAYSDLAIGFSRLLGITVPENFASPYLASNIREFWNRWHITLSRWVRDYIFVPTSRRLFASPLRARPGLIATVSYLVTFVIVGAWHGIAGAFVVWGAYHGVLLSLHQLLRARLPLWVVDSGWYYSRIVYAASVVVTFLFVAIGWVPFMTDLHTATRLLLLMFLGVAR